MSSQPVIDQDTTALTLVRGQKFVLDDNTWSSSLNDVAGLDVLYVILSPDVAVVDGDGTVSAISKGSAVIHRPVNDPWGGENHDLDPFYFYEPYTQYIACDLTPYFVS